MVYGIYSSAAGLAVNQYRQEILANNLANLSTAGFKQDLALVRERDIAARERFAGPEAHQDSLSGMSGGSLVAPTYTAFEQGPIQKTGNPLDVAINGEGFFSVQHEGRTLYTRDGRFMLNQNGQLVTVAGGNVVLSDQSTPIVVPEDATEGLRIDGNGEVRSGARSLGRIGVVAFDDKSLLRKTGGNLIESHGAQAVPVTAALSTGAIEGSTVDPMLTMVSMIQATRSYQLNATLVGLADQTLGRAVNDLARLR